MEIKPYAAVQTTRVESFLLHIQTVRKSQFMVLLIMCKKLKQKTRLVQKPEIRNIGFALMKKVFIIRMKA